MHAALEIHEIHENMMILSPWNFRLQGTRNSYFTPKSHAL